MTVTRYWRLTGIPVVTGKLEDTEDKSVEKRNGVPPVEQGMQTAAGKPLVHKDRKKWMSVHRPTLTGRNSGSKVFERGLIMALGASAAFQSLLSSLPVLEARRAEGAEREGCSGFAKQLTASESWFSGSVLGGYSTSHRVEDPGRHIKVMSLGMSLPP